MRIGFLGLCGFGFEYLKHLVRAGAEITFVTAKAVSSPHVRSLETACEALCSERGLTYLGSIDANKPEMVDRAQDTDLVIMGGYDGILRDPFVRAPRLGVINTHLALIPRHRGCYPVVWSILCDEVAGYSTYVVNGKIDLGELIDQGATKIEANESAKTLYERLSLMAERAFPEVFERASRWSWPALAYDPRGGCYHKAGMPNDRWISWHWTGSFLMRFSRALTFAPYPGPRTRFRNPGGEIELFIRETEVIRCNDFPGKILDMSGSILSVRCGDGVAHCNVPTSEVAARLEKGMILESVEGDIHRIPLKYEKDRFVF